MADDVWSALVKGSLGFAHSRAGDLTGDSFSDTGALVTSLFDSSPPGTAKQRLEQLKEDVKNLADVAKPVIEAVKPEVEKGKTAVVAMANELNTDPFTMAAAARATTELAKVLQALDKAMDVIAEEIAKPSSEPERTSIRNSIKGIKEPWIRPFRSLASDSTKLFDAFCEAVLGIQNAGDKLQDILEWNDTEKRIYMELVAAGERSPIPSFSFDGARVQAFLSFKTDIRLGLVLKTKLKAGMRGDKLLEKIMPGQPPTADTTEHVAITLDTTDGITLGNKDSKVTLPVRFAFPGVELREFALALPVDEDEKRAGKMDVTLTIAAKFGDVVAIVAEGAGVTLTMASSGVNVLSAAPRLPDGIGMRIDATVVKGGGYLRRKESEFGGVIDLKFTEIGITAIGLLGTDPFSLVVVIGVRFAPVIELGFGFTLNGLGGILALERRLESAALRSGIREGTVDTLLFPDDPVASAPKILDKLAAVFPPQAGAFVIGPIALLGWGSQAGFVEAKLGIVLCLPDPKLVLLGALEIAVPSTKVKDELKIVQLRAEIFGEFTPEYLLLLISISNSKIAGIPISGDLGLFIRWAGDAAFALSVGGFFPKYKAPAELSDMRRIAIDLSPAKWLSLRAEGYFAITANTVQFGGAIRLSADLAVASAKAWLSLDALFQWSPRFYFIVIIDAGIEVRAFGVTVCGVTFHGELQGTTPWRIEGRATVEILWWDVDVEIGPHEWGERDVATGVELAPVQVVAEALSADAAWTTMLPAGTDTLARLVRDESTPLLVHPLGALEVRQQRVPLETDIDRIGSASVKAKRVNLTNPQVGSVPAAVVAHAYDMFPPGHFISMTQDQQASRPDFERFPSGMQVSASRDAVFGGDANAVGVPYEWETVFPHENFGRGSLTLKFRGIARHALRTSGVATATRQRGNPYAPVTNGKGKLVVEDHGRVVIRRRDDQTVPGGFERAMTTTAAARSMEQLSTDPEDAFALVAAGVES